MAIHQPTTTTIPDNSTPLRDSLASKTAPHAWTLSVFCTLHSNHVRPANKRKSDLSLTAIPGPALHVSLTATRCGVRVSRRHSQQTLGLSRFSRPSCLFSTLFFLIVVPAWGTIKSCFLQIDRVSINRFGVYNMIFLIHFYYLDLPS
jgi:hypothetical protein